MNKRKYENMYILDPSLTEEQYKLEVEKISTFIKDNDGEIIEIDEWGKRKLAYEINKKKEGYYTVQYFNFDNKKMPELERYYRLNERIIRYIIILRED